MIWLITLWCHKCLINLHSMKLWEIKYSWYGSCYCKITLDIRVVFISYTFSMSIWSILKFALFLLLQMAKQGKSALGNHMLLFWHLSQSRKMEPELWQKYSRRVIFHYSQRKHNITLQRPIVEPYSCC